MTATLLDRRQLRSKAAMQDALERLVQHTPYSSISVSQIAQEAGVGRPTFYRYYRDVDAMLVERFQLVLDEHYALAKQAYQSGKTPKETLIQVSEVMLRCVAEQPDLFLPLLNGSAGANSVTIFRNQICRLIELLEEPRARNAPNITLTAGAVAGAISGFILTWAETGHPLPPAQAAEMMTMIVVPRTARLLGV